MPQLPSGWSRTRAAMLGLAGLGLAAIAVTAAVVTVVTRAGSPPSTSTPEAAAEPATSTPEPERNRCMDRPHVCGYPDETNTGVPDGAHLTVVEGDVHLTTPGEVYSGYEVRGTIYVEADKVTIESVRVVTGGYYPIRAGDSGNPVVGTVIRDVEIDMAGNDSAKGIAFDNYTAQRVWFHNGLDCAHAGVNVVIEDSFCDLPRLAQGSEAHADGFQLDASRNVTLRHNTIRNPNGQTSAILSTRNAQPLEGLVIDDNLVSGGGWTIQCGDSVGGVATTQVTDNRISREFFPQGGYWGPLSMCDEVAVSQGNVWDETGLPVT